MTVEPVESHQEPQSESLDETLPMVGDTSLNRSRKTQSSAAVIFLDKENQSLRKMTKRITLNLILNFPVLLTLRVANLSVSERAEILPDGPKAVFQTVNNPSKQAVIEAFYKNIRMYAFAPDSNPLLKNSVMSKRHLSVSNSVRALTRKI
jgi:hypothetical protein